MSVLSEKKSFFIDAPRLNNVCMRQMTSRQNNYMHGRAYHFDGVAKAAQVCDQLRDITYTLINKCLRFTFTYFRVHGEWDLTDTLVDVKNLTEHLPDGTVRTYPQVDFWVYLSQYFKISF
jgi:hypothetical protein